MIPPGLALSFQRFQCPESGRLVRAPQSLGALPIGYSKASGLLLPLAANECFWIGLRALDPTAQLELAVAATLRSGAQLEVFSGTVSDALRIEGIRGNDRTLRPLAREATHSEDAVARIGFRITARDQPERDAELELVDYARFSAECGVPPPAPLDPDAGYKGWRLP